MPLNIESHFQSEKKVWDMKIKGEVDIYTSNQFKDELQKISSQGQVYDIIIDFSDLDYIDSTGLGILIGVLKRLKQEEKEITIRHAKQNVRKLFNITGLEKIFIMEG